MLGKKTGRNSSIFFAAYVLSAFGHELIFFAMTLHIYNLTKNALNVGIFTTITFLPKLFSSVYGAITDRFDKRLILCIAAVLSSIIILSLALISNLGMLYGAWFLLSILLSLIGNTRTALMADIVPEDQYVQGNSGILVSSNSAKIATPLLAGIFTAVANTRSVLFLTCFIYIILSIICLKIGKPSASRREKSNEALLKQLKDALLYINQVRPLKYLTSLSFVWRLFLGLQTSLFVVYIRSFLLKTDAEYGFFMTAIGVSSILGSIAGSKISGKFSYGLLLTLGFTIHYSSFILLGIVQNYIASIIIISISFAAFYAMLVSAHSLRDLSTNKDIRGKVYGSVTSLMAPPALVSMLAGGYLSNLYGVDKVFIGTGILAIIGLILVNIAFKYYLPETKSLGSVRLEET